MTSIKPKKPPCPWNAVDQCSVFSGVWGIPGYCVGDDLSVYSLRVVYQ